MQPEQFSSFHVRMGPLTHPIATGREMVGEMCIQSFETSYIFGFKIKYVPVF
jgi:hypothetical protein